MLSVSLDDYLTDELDIHVESDLFSGGKQNSRLGGAAFVVLGMFVWNKGDDIYGAFDIKENLEIGLSSEMYDFGDSDVLLGFQENSARLNLGVVSHIRKFGLCNNFQARGLIEKKRRNRKRGKTDNYTKDNFLCEDLIYWLSQIAFHVVNFTPHPPPRTMSDLSLIKVV